MTTIKLVVVIYNPNSTGTAKQDATAFCKNLRDAGVSAKAVPTQHAGHAKEIAQEYADSMEDAMLVSASGDGGYNEVINGVLTSSRPHTITGVLPSGNANDHYHALHRGDTVQRIVRGAYKAIDVLELTYDDNQRFAHSYIGLGMTPQIGEQLTKERPSRWQEIGLVLKHFGNIRPVSITVQGRTKRYSHLAFSNIPRMSKVLKIADHTAVNDGLFEIIGTRAGSLLSLIAHLFHASTFGAEPLKHAKEFTFIAKRTLKVQLDGEVETIQRNTKVTVKSRHKLLWTIV